MSMGLDLMHDAVTKEIMKKVAVTVDLDAMAKRLKPQLEKAIEEAFVNYVNDGDMMYDLISESLDDKVYKSIRRHISGIFLSAFESRK